ncbi:MAG: polysaccharide biosynthesis protein PslF, partial [Subtercola sp.]|nr:polysaccharide biosynthesis protein PslF [Subtercola sp.]
PFWGTMGVQADVRSATVHDAPLSVWQPFRTRLVSRNRFVQHGLHFPILPLLRRFERHVMRGAHLFLMTESGAEATESMMSESEVTLTFHPVPDRPRITPVEERPLAIGLFGYVYRGKGFERLVELRAALDPRIAIRVAGRGTEKLEPMEGIEILGPVEGRAEDDFFASVRAMVLPYGRRSSYGPATHVASGTIARAISYETPAVVIRFPGVDNEMIVVDEFAQLAGSIEGLVEDDSALIRARTRLSELRTERTTRNAFDRYARTWQAALGGGSVAGAPPRAEPVGAR